MVGGKVIETLDCGSGTEWPAGRVGELFDEAAKLKADMESRVASLTASLEAAKADEMTLRKGWWLSHGCVGIYGDDGEMQCGSCMLDFKRAPVADIEKRIWERNAKFPASLPSGDAPT